MIQGLALCHHKYGRPVLAGLAGNSGHALVHSLQFHLPQHWAITCASHQGGGEQHIIGCAMFLKAAHKQCIDKILHRVWACV
jgi:hypothetical protein